MYRAAKIIAARCGNKYGMRKIGGQTKCMYAVVEIDMLSFIDAKDKDVLIARTCIECVEGMCPTMKGSSPHDDPRWDPANYSGHKFMHPDD